MKSSIIKSIKSLPPLPKTLLEINQVAQDESSSVAQLAKVIEKDPMILANLLKTANSPLYNFGKEISSATQVVSLFGISMTRSLALGHGLKKLLNVDVRPYGITSERFAEISTMQATLMKRWYEQLDKEKANVLQLAAFLQETGKILIASDVIQEDEEISFESEIQGTNTIAAVEKAYVDVTSAEVTAAVFKHWKFENHFIEMIHYADAPNNAPSGVIDDAMALHIVKTAIPVNKPLEEISINLALRKARDYGYDHELLEDVIDDMLDILEQH